MPEVYPDPHRAEVAEEFRAMEPFVVERERISPADLILELENPQHYTGLALRGDSRTGGSLRHWRMLVHSPHTPGLVPLEFGKDVLDLNLTQLDRIEAVASHAEFLDRALEAWTRKDANDLDYDQWKHVYERVGIAAVQFARNIGSRIFAALEIRYRPLPRDNDSGAEKWERWIHLHYSNALLDSRQYVRLEFGRDYPKWLINGANGAKRPQTAQAMAMGALAAYRRRPPS